MTIILIVVLVIMLVMNIAIFYVLWSAVGVTRKQVSSCFVKELEDYNDYLNDRKEECNRVKEQKEKMEREISSMEGVMVSLKASPFYAPKEMAHDLFVPTARYVDNEFFDAHKLVNEKMGNIDYDDIIRRIREKYTYKGNLQLYETAKTVLDGLNTETVYKLCTLTGDEQLEVLQSALDEEQNHLLDSFVNQDEVKKEFSIMDFKTYLREISTLHDPNMYIRVGDRSLLKPAMDGMIYQYDDNISEGIKIIFQNQNFDFSIYRLRSKK